MKIIGGRGGGQEKAHSIQLEFSLLFRCNFLALNSQQKYFCVNLCAKQLILQSRLFNVLTEPIILRETGPPIKTLLGVCPCSSHTSAAPIETNNVYGALILIL